MSEENSNTQTAPAAPAPSVALTPEQMQARIAELEKQSEGRLRDLQSERAKRQELEAKVNPATASSAATQSDATPQDELGKVLKPYIDPLTQRVRQAEAFVAKTYQDKALDYLSQKTGKSKEAVLQDMDLGNRMDRIVKKYGFTGNIYDVTQKAYEVMELENLRDKEMEQRRVADSRANASIPTGTVAPEPQATREYDEESFSKMPLAEYDLLSSKGSFVQDTKTGKIVYTPTSK